MKNKAYIIYGVLLDLKGENYTIGGIQTLLVSLADVLVSCGYEPIFVQKGEKDFVKKLNGVEYRGYQPSRKNEKNINKYLLNEIKNEISPDTDIIIWGSFYGSIKLKGFKTINIQHGIAFDLIRDNKVHDLIIKLRMGWLLKFLQRKRALNKFKNGSLKVCVDYNFLNWYRTYSLRTDDDSVYVIPNYSDILPNITSRKKAFKKILFARRFVEHRGVKIMLEASRVLLDKYNDIEVTFAGSGPLEYLIDKFSDSYNGRVKKTKYQASQSLSFHEKYDIAVVPTYGSEGTSFSLLEAMSAGCVPVCTNVGGMTNIVIDQYNGLIINPESHELIQAIERLHNDIDFSNKLRLYSIETIAEGFSKKIWVNRWKRVIDKISTI